MWGERKVLPFQWQKVKIFEFEYQIPENGIWNFREER